MASVHELLEGAGADPAGAFIVGANGEKVPIPASLRAVLLEALEQLELDRSVTVLPAEKDLTTQQAAELLNVSRPTLVGLLESGQLAFHMVGTHRRLKLTDVMQYRHARSVGRRAALREIARESQELGDYTS